LVVVLEAMTYEMVFETTEKPKSDGYDWPSFFAWSIMRDDEFSTGVLTEDQKRIRFMCFCFKIFYGEQRNPKLSAAHAYSVVTKHLIPKAVCMPDSEVKELALEKLFEIEAIIVKGFDKLPGDGNLGDI
jgi:hypothetical protein